MYRYWRANGIGEGIVRRLHDDGYAVLFCDVDTKNGEALSRELSSDNHIVHLIHCDIKSVANVNQMIDAARDLKLSIYSLINNA